MKTADYPLDKSRDQHLPANNCTSKRTPEASRYSFPARILIRIPTEHRHPGASGRIPAAQVFRCGDPENTDSVGINIGAGDAVGIPATRQNTPTAPQSSAASRIPAAQVFRCGDPEQDYPSRESNDSSR